MCAIGATGAAGASGATGATGATGTFDTTEPLFFVGGPNNTIPIFFQDIFRFETGTPETLEIIMGFDSVILNVRPGAGGLAAFAGLFNNVAETLTLTADAPQHITFNNEMPSLNIVSSTTASTILMPSSGEYEINFTLIGTITESATETTSLTLAVRSNQTNIISTEEFRTLTTGVDAIFSGSVIVTLSAGDLIDMAVTASSDAVLSLSSGTNAMLSVKLLTAL